MTSQFTLEVRVREEVGAWEECAACNGKGYIECHTPRNPKCSKCHGEGGKWHEAVKNKTAPVGSQLLRPGMLVRKDSRLYRFHDACSYTDILLDHPRKCAGKGYLEETPDDWQRTCPRCNGTGCEPGTATGWRVYKKEIKNGKINL